jgi:Leucine-rich repeat (LRR) protein
LVGAPIGRPETNDSPIAFETRRSSFDRSASPGYDSTQPKGVPMTYRTTRLLALLVGLLVFLAACQPPLDRTPDPFSFTPLTGVEPGAVVTSNAITVSGIEAPARLEVSGGDAVALVNGDEVDSGSFVSQGDEVQVRLTASSEYSTTVTATVTIGGVSADFSVTTRAEDVDDTPDAFSFTAVVDAELGQGYTSNVVTVSGIAVPVAASVSGDASAVLIVNGDDIDGDVDVVAGDEVQVRLTASDEYSTTVTATVTIGGVSADFSVTTRSSPVVPVIEAFTAEPVSALWGDEDVELTWTVTGDVTTLSLSNDYDGLPPVDVTGLTGTTVTVPSDVPAITYTLTATNDELAAIDSDDLAIEIELWVCSDTDDEIIIPDSALEEAVRSYPQIPIAGPITCGNILALTALETGHTLDPVNYGDIESLVGLQHAANLTVLDVQVNLVQDLTPITNLVLLEELVLDLNPVEDLGPIAGLTNLTTLSLWFLQERDEEAFPYNTDDFSGVPCGEAGISDLSALAGLTGLTELYLSFNAVTDLSPLAGMVDLEILFVMCNGIESLAPLTGMTNLAVLWANHNAVNDTGAGAVDALTGLQLLRLEFNSLSDLSPLEALPVLYAVGLDGNFLESIAALADNTAFPEVPSTVPIVWPPSGEPELTLAYNCLDTTEDSPADLDVGIIEGRGVTVTGFEEASQRAADECDLFVPSMLEFRLQIEDRPMGIRSR